MTEFERTLSIGQEHELVIALEKGGSKQLGITSTEAQALCEGAAGKRLTDAWLGDLRARLNTTIPILDLHSDFDPQRQIDSLRAINKRCGKANGWKFGDRADFSKLGDPPAWPTNARLPLVVLCATLDTVAQSFEEGVQAAFRAQPRGVTCNNYLGDGSQLSVQVGGFVPARLEWVAMDMAAHWESEAGRAVQDIDDPSLAGLQIPWAFHHYPVNYVQQQDGIKVPRVDMAALRYGRHVPYFDWWIIGRGRGLDVRASSAGRVSRKWAAPRLLGTV